MATGKFRSGGDSRQREESYHATLCTSTEVVTPAELLFNCKISTKLTGVVEVLDDTGVVTKDP